MITKQFSIDALAILKTVLVTTGEKENINGQEQPASRRLNGEESSQRRFFITKTEPLFEEAQEKRKTLIDSAKIKWKEENPKLENEADKDYDKRCDVLVNVDKDLITAIKEMYAVEHQVELEQKTWNVVYKYFKEFSEAIGWLPGDDDTVATIADKFKV
jgi:hypothetical protein